MYRTAFLLFASSLASVAFADAPRDGVVTLRLEELWRRGGLDDDLLFGVISQVVEDEDGNLYLLDAQLHEIQVLDQEGEWLRSIGHRGEGPGEFQNPGDLTLGPSGLLGVVQVFPGKIVQLTTDGDPADNYPIAGLEGSGFNVVSVARGAKDRIIVGGADSGPTSNLNYLRSFAPDGKLLVEFHREEVPFQFGSMKFVEKTHRNFMQRWALAKDGRVAAALDFDRYKIHVWKSDGSVDRILERPDYSAVRRSGEEKALTKRIYEGFTSWNPNSTYEAADTHMTIAQLAFRDDGSLWVLPADGMWKRPAGSFAVYDVFDVDGVYTQRVRLMAPGDPVRDGVFFSQNRVYVVTDLLGAAMSAFGGGEEGDVDSGDAVPMEIIAYKIPATSR